eukprot:9168930-Pyramimonas_sp.AAC.1
MLSRPWVAATSFERMRARMKLEGRMDPCKGFAPLTIHMKTGNVVAIAAYLQPGLLFRGISNDILVALAAFTSALTDPWIIVADWNIEPAAFRDSGWLRQLRGRMRLPDAQ